MAAVHSLRVSVKSDSGSDRSDSDSESESDRDAREAEPMEVEEGELDLEAEDISVNRSLKELVPDTSRRYENKAGAFITGIDVNSKVQHLLRMEAIHVTGVDDMSTQDVFGYFKEYPPAHIEWIDDTSCNVVWLDDDTSIRALINSSHMPDPEEAVTTETEGCSQPGEQSKGRRGQGSDEEEEGEVDEDEEETAKKSNDKKELGAARRSRYYMKYGNPNYGGMKGILSNSWKRRYHNRRIQRDVIKSKKPLIGDSMGHTPPYTHRHSADLVNLPEEPIKEEEEEEEEEDSDEDMDSDDRVVEYRERGERGGGGGGSSRSLGAGLRSRAERSPSPWSESDEMDYDLELKMISTPSPKKSKKMTMYADELETHLKSIRSEPPPVLSSPHLCWRRKDRDCLSTDRPPRVDSASADVRQRLGKRRYSPDRQRSPSPVSPRETPPVREPIRDVHRRLGVASQDNRGLYSNSSKDRKTGGLWSRLGSSDDSSSGHHDRRPSGRSSGGSRRRRGNGEEGEEEEEEEEEDDSTLQRMWGAMIKQKQDLSHKMKKSRLDNLPSLQIEISRDSSDESDA
uniref:Nuclear cap-binding protein subunit 3 n=1 Tax=Seriola lalandi dorsalis TaxID=1841481 RepID=A0A3B4WA53_SERLL